jgi:hypothetical protein
MLCIQEVPGSNLRVEAGYLTEIFCSFTQSLQGNYRMVPQIRQQLFLYTLFPIHYSLITALFKTIYQGWPKLLNITVILYTPWNCDVEGIQKVLLYCCILFHFVYLTFSFNISIYVQLRLMFFTVLLFIANIT